MIEQIMANAELIEALQTDMSEVEDDPVHTLSLMWRAADALEAADKRIKELESQAAFFDAEKLNYQENIVYRDERIKELETRIEDLETALAACRIRRGERNDHQRM